MKYCQSDSCVIFRRVYRLNNVRNEITISWSGGFATLSLHTRIRAKEKQERFADSPQIVNLRCISRAKYADCR